MTTDLKPCPFQTCGGKKILIDQSISLWFAYCTNCGARGPQRQSKAGAADAWNARVSPPAPDAAGLVAAMETINGLANQRDYSSSYVIGHVASISKTALRAYRAAGRPDAGVTGRIPGKDLIFARQHVDEVKKMNLTPSPTERNLMFALENILDYLQDAEAKERP